MSQRFSANGWFAASIYRPDTGDVVQLNELVPELCAIENGTIQQELTFSKYQAAKSHVLKIGSTDFDAFETIRQWSEEKRLVRAVVAGIDRNVQFYESVEIGEFLLEPKGNRRDGDTKWGIALEAIGRNPQVFNNQNLLAYLGWKDSNSNNIADGYIRLNGESAPVYLFTAGQQSVNFGATNRGLELGVNVEFPISNLALTKSAKKVSGNTLKVGVRSLSFAGATLANEVSAGTFSNVTPVAITSTTVSNVYFVAVFMFPENGVTFPTPVVFENPALTVNGKLTPGTKFMGW